MSHKQKHDLGVQKRSRQELIEVRRKRSREPARHFSPLSDWTCIYCRAVIRNGATHTCRS